MSRHTPWKHIRICPDIGAVEGVRCPKHWNCRRLTGSPIGTYSSNPWNYDRPPGRSPSLQYSWKRRGNSEVDGVRDYLFILVLLLGIGHPAINCQESRELRGVR